MKNVVGIVVQPHHPGPHTTPARREGREREGGPGRKEEGGQRYSA